MNIPDKYKTLFKQVVADTFYDKEADAYTAINDVGEELDAVIKKGDFIENIKCNVHQVSNESVQRDYGLAIEASIMITCDKTVAKIGDIITYRDTDYTITGILTPDSHTKIFAKLGVKNG